MTVLSPKDSYREQPDLVSSAPEYVPHYPLMPLRIAGHVFETLYKPFHATPPIFPRRVDWFRQCRAFNISKAKREIGYLPKVALDEGLRTGVPEKLASLS